MTPTSSSSQEGKYDQIPPTHKTKLTSSSDTTAVSLTCLFFELATNKKACETLQAEIDERFAEGQSIDHASLAKMKYLQACIDESLRLHPPVPSGLQRMTPREGLQIGETFIPGDTIIQIPTYTLYRGKLLSSPFHPKY